MASLPKSIAAKEQETPLARWTRRFLIALTIWAGLGIAGVVLLGISKIGFALVILGLSMLIAYVIYPVVKLLRRVLPGPLAILLVYLGVFGLLMLLLYFVLLTAIGQLLTLISNIQASLPTLLRSLDPFVRQMQRFGISPNSFSISSQQVLDQVLNVVNNLVPIASNIFLGFINTIIVTSLSIYFLLAGPRVLAWSRTSLPLRFRKETNFFLDTVHQTMSGFIRGQVTLATVTSVIMGLGYTVIGVPYVMLIVVVIFIFEFIPQVGSYISISLAVLLTFVTSGWQMALVVIVFSSLIQAGLNGQILAPRILGHSVGIHPIISIGALLVGAELFGLVGAFLAAPIAGIIQIIVVAYWQKWKATHPQEFPDQDLTRLEGKMVTAVHESTGRPENA